MLEYLATYRDLSIIFADSIAVQCAKLAPGDRPSDCNKLVKSFADNLHDVSMAANPDYRPISAALKMSINLADNEKLRAWKLDAAHIAAILVHIDRVCEELVREQQSDIDTKEDWVICGKAVDGVPAKFDGSPRQKFGAEMGVDDS